MAQSKAQFMEERETEALLREFDGLAYDVKWPFSGKSGKRGFFKVVGYQRMEEYISCVDGLGVLTVMLTIDPVGRGHESAKIERQDNNFYCMALGKTLVEISQQRFEDQLQTAWEFISKKLIPA